MASGIAMASTTESETEFNPQRISYLIENGAGDDFVTSLVLKMAVRGLAPMAELIQVFEEHHKLKMLLPLLEARMDEGAQDEALHNALAKIYIDTDQNPEKLPLPREERGNFSGFRRGGGGGNVTCAQR
jgi:hypothetical protein